MTLGSELETYNISCAGDIRWCRNSGSYDGYSIGTNIPVNKHLPGMLPGHKASWEKGHS